MRLSQLCGSFLLSDPLANDNFSSGVRHFVSQVNVGLGHFSYGPLPGARSRIRSRFLIPWRDSEGWCLRVVVPSIYATGVVLLYGITPAIVLLSETRYDNIHYRRLGRTTQ